MNAHQEILPATSPGTTLRTPETNQAIAARLRMMAETLDQQDGDAFRIAAYRRAADTIEAMNRPIDEIFSREGVAGLVALPSVGRGIAAAIAEMLTTGRWAQLDRMQGALEPERLFQTMPGIGPALAQRIHNKLHIDTLEQLEMAAHDGSLENLEGIGARRAAALRALLAERLARRRLKAPRRGRAHAPGVDLLLDVDREYRRRAAAGDLRLIAPKRFNPDGEAWLPILHAIRGDWRFTALFSNTLLAHQLTKTRDWVILYFHQDEDAEAQCTVVTEARGPLSGHRVVRGRENECARYYEAEAAHASDRPG
jgi:DNA polymerase (family 10)